MKKYFESDKPSSLYQEFMPDFIAGYESCIERLKTCEWRDMLNEFSARHPSAEKAISLKAYFYAKGEFAALGDNI